MLTEIRSGGYVATVTSDGAGLVSFKKDGANLAVPQDSAQFPTGFLGDILAPWAGRLEDATYTFEGATYTVPVTDEETGGALHGLVATRPWSLVDAGADYVVHELLLGNDAGYPFQVRLTSTHRVDAATGLTHTITASNEGDGAAPMVMGAHPYLTCGGAPIERCVLSLPASKAWEFNERKLPDKLVDFSGSERDFSRGRLVADTEVDHMYLAEFDGPQWTAELRDPATGMAVQLSSDEKWIQVFTANGMGRVGVAVEPLTGAVNALNTGLDLTVLQPGETADYQYSIRQVG